jgi:hypothetical protein
MRQRGASIDGIKLHLVSVRFRLHDSGLVDTFGYSLPNVLSDFFHEYVLAHVLKRAAPKGLARTAAPHACMCRRRAPFRIPGREATNTHTVIVVLFVALVSIFVALYSAVTMQTSNLVAVLHFRNGPTNGVKLSSEAVHFVPKLQQGRKARALSTVRH